MNLKILTLRNYLFILVALLILMLATSQILLLHYFKENFNTEVDSKASKLSEHLVELAVDELVFDGKEQERKTHVIKKYDNENDSSDVNINWVESPKTDHHTKGDANAKKTIKIYQLQDDEQEHTSPNSEGSQQETAQITVVDKKHIRQQLKTVVKQLKANKQLKGGQQSHIIEYNFEQEYPDTLTPLIYKIQLAIVLTTLVALAFAFWLSRKFNKPLQELSLGFKKLAEGDYKHQVKESGIDEIRQTIKQFNQMTQRLKSLSELESKHQEMAHLAELGEVSRGLAHALRTPIHTLGLLTDKLKNTDVSEQAVIIQQLHNKIYSLDNYIKALLTLTTKGINRQQNIRLIDVIQDIKLELLSEISQMFSVEIHCDQNIYLRGDESEIRSIVHTLLNNALAANLQSQSHEAIKINVDQQQEQVSIIIEDHGQGLSADIKAQLFKPHISSKADGAGMGLYIAQRIIRLHYQGNIELANCKQHQGCVAKAHFYLLTEQ